MSLCLDLMRELQPDNLHDFRQIFDSQLVTFEAYCQNSTGILDDPNLVVRIDSDQYYE